MCGLKCVGYIQKIIHHWSCKYSQQFWMKQASDTNTVSFFVTSLHRYIGWFTEIFPFPWYNYAFRVLFRSSQQFLASVQLIEYKGHSTDKAVTSHILTHCLTYILHILNLLTALALFFTVTESDCLPYAH